MSINFDDSGLVEKYGSWVRVQVAFYDFLFEKGVEVHAGCFNKAAVSVAIAGGEFSDGGDLYENAIACISSKWDNAESAWRDFVSQ